MEYNVYLESKCGNNYHIVNTGILTQSKINYGSKTYVLYKTIYKGFNGNLESAYFKEL